MVPSTVVIVKGNHGNLMSGQTAKELELLRMDDNQVVNHVSHITDKHPDLFKDVGKLTDYSVHLHVNPNVQPVGQSHRRIQFHQRKAVELELKRLESEDIIEKVVGPTPWVSQILVVPKPNSPGEIRICIDMRLPNQAIQRTRHITPTIDDLILDLNGAAVFSQLDLRSGYHQLELDEEPRQITTLSTQVGIRRYKRVFFGINCASELFQNAIAQVIDGIPDARNISDDIIVFGSTQCEHDRSIELVRQRLSERNLTVNQAKCAFNKTSIEYFGHVFSQKVEAVHKAGPPSDASEVCSLLGLATYTSRFIPDFATLTQPLRELTRADVSWRWNKGEQDALDKLKEHLASETTMSYFSLNRNTEIYTDASPVSLAAVLGNTMQPARTNHTSWRTQVAHSLRLNRGIHRSTEKLWQLCGVSNTSTYTSTAAK